MSVDVFLEKSRRNIATARASIETDAESACNRGYYAMRDTARAALLVLGEHEAAQAKTHSGLRAQFNLHLIKTGILPTELNAYFVSAAQQRMIADYDGVFLSPETVAVIVANAEQFHAAVVRFIEQHQ